MTQHDSNLLREARMQVKAQEGVLETSDWFSAADIARMADDVSLEDGAQLSQWEQQGQVFSIPHKGSRYYPGYGFEIGATIRPHPALAAVLKSLRGNQSGWALAFWFASANSYLNGKRPIDLFTSELAKVLVAAKHAVSGITHG